MNGTNRYFAAANTAGGFYSLFGSLFDPFGGEYRKIYILKGGPGTGKSSFMKQICHAASERGIVFEQYHCSSDTKSLDGIRIPSLGIAVLDGTAPHAVDPSLPGAVEEIINLGMFFDTARLYAHEKEIGALFRENASHHRRASHFLRAAGEMRRIVRSMTDACFDKEKAGRFAQRTVSLCPTEKEECITHTTRITTAHSTEGTVHFDTAERSAGRCVYVTDKQGLAHNVLSAIVDAATVRGISYVRYTDPLMTKETEGVYLPGCDTVWYSDRYLAKKENTTPLNASRFYHTERLSETRERRRFTRKCEAAMTEGAYDALREAGRVHDALEAYYIDAMDFSLLDAYTKRFMGALFS